MASPTQWTWVWVNSGSLWWTGRPGVLQSMGSQTVRHDWATEMNWWIIWGWWKSSDSDSVGLGWRPKILLFLQFSWSWQCLLVFKPTSSALLLSQSLYSIHCVSLPVFSIMVNGITIHITAQLETWAANFLFFTPAKLTSNTTDCYVVFVSWIQSIISIPIILVRYFSTFLWTMRRFLTNLCSTFSVQTVVRHRLNQDIGLHFKIYNDASLPTK